jgi:hypothetical protein
MLALAKGAARASGIQLAPLSSANCLASLQSETNNDLDVGDVLVQREMENGRSPVV